MTGALRIAQSALSAYQIGLNTVSNNIANSDTEGYSRQRNHFTTRLPNQLGTLYIGSGVSLSTIQRLNSEYASENLENKTSDYNRFEAFYTNASELDIYLSQEESSISTALNLFYDSLADANTAPDNLPVRTALMGQLSFLTDRFNDSQTQMGELLNISNQQISGAVEQINVIASNLAELNLQIASDGASTSPELLDERDRMKLELSRFVNVNAVTEADGSQTISIGSGLPLVVSGETTKYTTKSGAIGNTEILLTTSSGVADVTASIVGGGVQGLLDFQSAMVLNAQNNFGQMAVGFSMQMNTLQNQGIDMSGIANAFGDDILTDYNSATIAIERVIADDNNTGTASLSMTINDINDTYPSNYSVAVGASGLTITRLNDGTEVATPPNSLPLTFDGFTLSLTSGAVAVGDSFELSPFSQASGLMSIQNQSPKAFALAGPIATSFSTANRGDANLSFVEVTDTSNTFFKDDFSITLTNVDRDAGTFDYTITDNTNGAGSIATLSGSVNTPIAVQGYSVMVIGDPREGDTFTSGFNNGGYKDNSNGLLMSQFQTDKTFLGNSESIMDRFSISISEVGSATFSAGLQLESSTVLLNSASERWGAISGVNLDEEAISLLNLQQSYQANARVVGVLQQVMQDLLAII